MGDIEKLTPRQARFVQEYLIDLNATQAAARAGYSKKTAGKQGTQLLAKTSVAQAIAQAQARRQARTEITQDRVLEELGAVAFRAASDGQASDLRYPSKLRALELLGRHLGLFDKTQTDGQAEVRIIDDV